MKKIIFLFFILIAFKGYSQVYQVMPQYGYQMPRADIQLVLKIPSDTTNNKTGIARIGTVLYSGNGTYWTAASGGGSTDTTSLSNRINTTNAQVTANTAAIAQRQLYADTSTYDATKNDLNVGLATKQNTLTLTTTGTSGAATLISDVLNIPQYSSTALDTTTIYNNINKRLLNTIPNILEDRKPMLDLKVSGSYIRGWIDGQFLWSVNDTLYSYGGWFTGNTIYDTIYRTVDDGLTWQKESFALPYPVHTVANCEGTDGYNYMIGGDPFTTLTQRKTVSRTKDGGRTWETMTTNAPFISILGNCFMDEYGTLYYGGGQHDLNGSLCDTLWKSTDGGANWQIHATGMSILAGNKSNLLKYYNGRAVIATGGIYSPPSSSTFLKKTYSFEIDKPNQWVEHEDLPAPSGLHYANAVVYDGKYWLFQGANSSAVNTNGIYYLDAKFKWNTYPNYAANNKAATLSNSHANGITVHRNKIFIGVGNENNAVHYLEPSNYQQYIHFRDSFKLGQYTNVSEVENSLATVIGNNAKAGLSNNTLKRVKGTDAGNYYRIGLDGNYWGTISGSVPAGTEVTDLEGVKMKLNNSGELIISTNPSYDVGTQALQVNGAAHISNTITAPFYASSNAILYTDASGNFNNGSTLTYSNRLNIGGTSGLVYPPTYGVSSLATAAGSSNGVSFTNTSATGYNIILMGQNTSNYSASSYWGTSYAGNYAGTSLPLAASKQIQVGSTNNQNLVLSSGAVIHNVGVTSTNTGFRSDITGFRIGRNSNIHTANTVQFEVEGTLKFVTGNQGVNKYLISDASGNATWAYNGGTISNKSANYTITNADNVINATTSGITITLPTAVGNDGKEFTIINSTSSTVTVNTTSSQLIGNFTTATSYTLSSDKSVTVKSDNSNYKIKTSN